MRKRLFIALAIFCVCGDGFAQGKSIQAIKIPTAPKIDGNLNDAVWQSIPLATGFVQNFPTAGAAPSQKTEVRIAYDDAAVYIGAYLYDDPKMIRKQLTARDGEQRQDVDYFSVFLDTYNDDQNGFQFLVTSANVQSDARIGPNLELDFGEYGDKTWQAVWESNVSINEDGWSVEIRIPYLSLRFSKKPIQDWGVNFLRYMRRLNENDFWSPVDPQASGFVNQFGDFIGLKDIQPPLRLSFSPYVTAGYRTSPQSSGYKKEFLRNGGMDVKYGINESFTIDATLIPDFGQVISDNVIQNLTPYEVQFQENRPFFTEGTELFNKAGIFYSRRVGATPGGYQRIKDFVRYDDPNWEIVKNPSVTQLYNGIKFSGRNRKNFGIGVFNAVAAPSDATIHNRFSGKDSVIKTDALTNYNIIVLDKALKGQSYLTFTNTNVTRSGAAPDANVSSFDFAFFDRQNKYGLSGATKYSKIFQTNSYDGYNANLRFAKVSGNWQYSIAGDVLSDGYNPNDLGYLLTNNTVTYSGGITYKKYEPTKTFITYSYGLAAIGNYLYKPYAYARTDLEANGFVVFKNFWDLSMQAILNPGRWKDYFELQRPGEYYLNYPVNYSITMSGSTDSRKKAYVSFGGSYARTPELNTTTFIYQLGLRYRFSDRFSLSLNTDATKATDYLGNGFISGFTGGAVAANRDIDQFTTLLTGIYNFTSRLNITLRARHYWLKLKAKEFYDVNAFSGALTKDDAYFNLYFGGQKPYILFNQNFFNVDAFLTWDFRLGSRIIFGWKNWLGDDEAVDGNQHRNYLNNFGKVLNMRHGNELTLRFIYFLDYNQLKKNRK